MDTLKYASIALAAGLFAACTGPGPGRPGVDVGALESRAERQAEAGNLATAAGLYVELAAASLGDTRAAYLIEAARLEIEQGRWAEAGSRLREARSTGGSDQRQAADVLLARIDLEQGRAEAALDRLERIPASAALDVLRDASAVRGRALFAVGRVVDAVRELTEREIWLERTDEILANQRMIWEGLGNLPPDTRPEPTGEPLIDGWLALTPLAHTPADSADFRVEMLQWRSTYDEHPAAGGLLAELLSARRGEATHPGRVALLLPLGSRERQAAIAVRDGFMAGHFEADDEAAVRVYDTATLGADQAYQQAQLEGADFIVGPLLRSDVEQVAQQSGFVPTLALNFTSDNDAPFLNSFYEFALSYEDEAAAIAQRAIAEGAQTAVAFVASDDWGYRLLDAFRNEFEALGGELLEFSGYDPSATDFSGAITTVLNIDASRARERRLAANLGRAVEFEPRRRQDVDMIFLAADAAAGRLIVPQLRFHGAGGIPVYAPRDIHEPARAERDTDLDGVRFPDAPLLLAPDREADELRRTVESFWPDNGAQRIRFYGLGYDAYALMTALYGPGRVQWPIAGVTGRLTLDSRGRIRRGLSFGEFRNGEPATLETLLPPDIEPSTPALSRR